MEKGFIKVRLAGRRINLIACNYLRQIHDEDGIIDIDDYLESIGMNWICDEDYVFICQEIERRRGIIQ